jgi:hypothetical protein
MPYKDKLKQLSAMLKINKTSREKKKTKELDTILYSEMLKSGRNYPKFRQTYPIIMSEHKTGVLIWKAFEVNRLVGKSVAEILLDAKPLLEKATFDVCDAEMEYAKESDKIAIVRDFGLDLTYGYLLCSNGKSLDSIRGVVSEEIQRGED